MYIDGKGTFAKNKNWFVYESWTQDSVNSKKNNLNGNKYINFWSDPVLSYLFCNWHTVSVILSDIKRLFIFFTRRIRRFQKSMADFIKDFKQDNWSVPLFFLNVIILHGLTFLKQRNIKCNIRYKYYVTKNV